MQAERWMEDNGLGRKRMGDNEKDDGGERMGRTRKLMKGEFFCLSF